MSAKSPTLATVLAAIQELRERIDLLESRHPLVVCPFARERVSLPPPVYPAPATAPACPPNWWGPAWLPPTPSLLEGYP